MCKFPDINRPPKCISGYWLTTEGMCRIPTVYGEGHEGDRGPLPPPFLHSFFTLALLPLALLLPFAIALALPHYPSLIQSLLHSMSPILVALRIFNPCTPMHSKSPIPVALQYMLHICSLTLRVPTLQSTSIALLHHLRSPCS